MADDLVVCKHCGAQTPEDNFNCIYCGEVIYEESGFLGGLKYGRNRLYTMLIACLILLAFFLWYIIW